MSTTYQFEVMIKQVENGQYLAAVPVLPGCFGIGKTVEEAREKVAAAARCYCWNMIENGAPVPQVDLRTPIVIKEISVRL